MGIGESTMESLVASSDFWRGKKVFLTGHTGFKGSWLSLWLLMMGASVHGYAKGIPTRPSLHGSLGLQSVIPSTTGDIRDEERLSTALLRFGPDIVVHMAAQALVRNSYREPLDTLSTNIIGTANLLEACRKTDGVRVFLNVTSDKCYQNREWVWGYRENDRLGGNDPYSCSKACAELVTRAYRESFFKREGSGTRDAAIATARAGNVVGGGDWAADRCIPDCIRGYIDKKKVVIRNPESIRPWQYVLDPLNGYLILMEKLFTRGSAYAGAWNFGPGADCVTTVGWFAETIARKLGIALDIPQTRFKERLPEARMLKLDSAKAMEQLKWCAMVPLEKAIDQIVRWVEAYISGENMMDVSTEQIVSFRRYAA